MNNYSTILSILLVPIPSMAALIIFAIHCFRKQNPTLETLSNVLRRTSTGSSWGNLELLPIPTPDIPDDIETGLRTPAPVLTIRRYNPPAELFRFRPRTHDPMTFIKNSPSIPEPSFHPRSAHFAL